MAKNPRPILVTLVGILFAIIAIFSLIIGIICCLNINADIYNIGLTEETLRQILDLMESTGMSFGNLILTIGISYIVFGVIYAILSLGNFKGWMPIWFIAIVVMLISAILDIIAIVEVYNGGLIVSIVIDVLILVYLFTPKVKAFFLK